jgi:hypothetical protein
MKPTSDDPAKTAQLRLLRALDEAAAKLEAVERSRSEPIAVIGLGCRLPGGVRESYCLQLYPNTSGVPSGS